MIKKMAILSVVILLGVLFISKTYAEYGTCTEGDDQVDTTAHLGGYLTEVYPGNSTCPGIIGTCCQPSKTGTKKTYQTGSDGTPCNEDTLRSTDNNYSYLGC